MFYPARDPAAARGVMNFCWTFDGGGDPSSGSSSAAAEKQQQFN